MKKTILLLLLIVNGHILFSQTINFPDSNFKMKIIAEGVDTNNDGEIQVAEALAINILDIRSLTNDPNKFSNMEGIQYFTNLEELNCSGNLVETLDASDLTQLKILKAYFNNLTSINVDGLANLEQLWLQGNQLNNIETNSLQSLQWLWCDNNHITTLNLNPLQNLTSLSAYNNQIETLDLSALTMLDNIDVDNNLLSHLEVKHLNTLRSLRVSNNLIESIDLSDMPNLEEVYIGFNLLEELDCNTTGAYYIHCENNPELTSINAQNEVISKSDPDMLDYGFYFFDLPNLESICMDPGEEGALAESGYDPNNVTIYKGPNCTLSTEEFSFDKSFIYPNPVKNDFNISLTQNIAIFVLLDYSGKTIVKTKSYQIIKDRTNALSSGLYLLQIANNLGEQDVIKFIKE